MARRAGIPDARDGGLSSATFLQKKLAAPIENEEVNGAMEQVIPMHFAREARRR